MNSTLTRTLLFAVMLASAWNPLPVSAAPKDLVLSLDISSSMKEIDPEFLVRVAARNFIEGLSADDRVAVLVFNRKTNLLMPLTSVDEMSRPEILRSLRQVEYHGSPADGQTAIERAIRELRLHGRTEADRCVVFITGGAGDRGSEAINAQNSEALANELAATTARHKVRIFGVGFNDHGDPPWVRALSKLSSVEYFRADTAAELEGVFRRITGALERTRKSAEESLFAPVRSETQSTRTILPGPAPLPELELPDAAPLLVDPIARAESRDSDASDETMALPAIEDSGATASSALPTPSKARTSFETSMVLKPTQQLARAGASADTMTPAAKTEAASPGEHARPKTVPSAAAEDAGRRKIFLELAWLTALLAAGLLGAALTVRMSLSRRRRAADQTRFEDQLPKAFLNDLSGVSEKPSYELGESVTVIGRIKGGDAVDIDYVVIPEPTVGRRHALIEFRHHCFWVADQNSLNGTFINGERIEGDARLKHGDRIRFHRHEFEFLLLDMVESDCTKLSQTAHVDFPRAADDDDQIQPPAREDSGEAALR